MFLAVTGLTVKDFHLLVRLKVFNTEQINQAVFAFRRYEDASLRYTGIESHEGNPPKKSEPTQNRLRPILSWSAIADRARLTAGGQARRVPISWITPIAVCWLPVMSLATKP